MSMLKRISKLRRRSRQPAEGDASSEAGETSEDSSEVSKVDFIPPLEIEKKMPTYFTMGNLAKECLIRGFEIGIWHLECTMRSNNLSTYSIGKANPDLNSVSGGVGMREKFGSFSLAQAWQTDGLLGLIAANSEVLGAGVYSVLKGFYGPHGSAAPKVELLAGFERAPLKSEIIIPVLHSPKFMGYLLLQPIEHFLFGGRLEFDVEQRQIDMHALCVGYVDDTTEYMLKLEKFKDLRGSVFQRLGDKWAVALKANLFGENMKAFTVGGQYQVDEKTLLKARISDDCQVGFVCQIKVTDNIEGIYYFGFDGNSPMSGDHKVGISWSFKA